MMGAGDIKVMAVIAGYMGMDRGLYNMPPAAQIYVVVHEYCHFLQPNHSPAFWAEVEKLLPDWKERRALLK